MARRGALLRARLDVFLQADDAGVREHSGRLRSSAAAVGISDASSAQLQRRAERSRPADRAVGASSARELAVARCSVMERAFGIGLSAARERTKLGAVDPS